MGISDTRFRPTGGHGGPEWWGRNTGRHRCTMKLRSTATAVILVATVLAACPPAWAFHHPTAGRWMQRDPAGYVDGVGSYEYGRSSPCGYVDPSGMEAMTVAEAEIAILRRAVAGSSIALRGGIYSAAVVVGVGGAVAIDWVAHGEPIWKSLSRARLAQARAAASAELAALVNVFWDEVAKETDKQEKDIRRRGGCNPPDVLMFRYYSDAGAIGAATWGWRKGAYITPDFYLLDDTVHDRLQLPTNLPLSPDVPSFITNPATWKRTMGSYACLKPSEFAMLPNRVGGNPQWGEGGGREAVTQCWISPNRIGLFPLLKGDVLREYSSRIVDAFFKRNPWMKQ